jgi:hypothetical protein
MLAEFVVALRPANDLDNPHKPPRRAALQHWSNQGHCTSTRDSGGSRSCATRMNPRTTSIILTSRQRRSDQPRRNLPRDSGGSRSCATRVTPRTTSIIPTSRPGGRPSNIGAIKVIALRPANPEGRDSARLIHSRAQTIPPWYTKQRSAYYAK